MEPKLVEYYRRELNFLLQSGREFARAHPDEARRLGLAGVGGDPHVERLLEGVALLTARIRAKIDDELPEVTDAMLGVLYPDGTRPTPSMSIVKVEVQADQAAALRNGTRIPAGSALRTRRVGGEQACEFRTAYDLRLWPIDLGPPRVSSEIAPSDASAGARAFVSVPIRCLGSASFGELGADFASLRFHLGGEGRGPYALRERVLNEALRVEVRPVGASDVAPIVYGPPDLARHLRPVGFGADEAMLPCPGRSFPGYRNLREYFTFPEKFLFFELGGLGRLRGWGRATEAELRIFLKRPIDADVKLGAESFQLHCTPIVNLFRKECAPIRISGSRLEYPVEPDARRDLELEVFSVEEVRSESGPFRPFYTPGFGGPSGGPTTFWYAKRTPSIPRGSKGTLVALCFVDGEFRPLPPRGRTVSVEALCTNLDLPSRLPVADLEPLWQAANGAVRRIAPMTRASPPPMGPDAQWRLIACLSLNHLPIDDPAGGGAEALRTLLRVHAPPGEDESAEKIKGVVGVECRPDVAHLKGRGVVGGVRTTIEFDEGKYAQGHLLLAEVLENFLGHFVSINAFSRLVATSGGREHRWPPRAGDRILI